MPKSEISGVTAEEIIALLRRSSLPTIVVEGGDDMIIFRKLEDELSSLNVDVLNAGGRNTLLEVFNRRAEIDNGKRTAFIADKDWWVCAAIPGEFVCRELLFTDGYSIENDVYRDGNLERYLDASESQEFRREIALVIKCFALGISRIINNRDGRVATHPNLILNDAAQRAQLLELRAGEMYPAQLEIQIAANYGKLLRGKTLMGVLMRQLSRASRPVRHNSKAMMDFAGNNRGPLLNRLFQQVSQVFA